MAEDLEKTHPDFPKCIFKQDDTPCPKACICYPCAEMLYEGRNPEVADRKLREAGVDEGIIEDLHRLRRALNPTSITEVSLKRTITFFDLQLTECKLYQLKQKTTDSSVDECF